MMKVGITIPYPLNIRLFGMKPNSSAKASSNDFSDLSGSSPPEPPLALNPSFLSNPSLTAHSAHRCFSVMFPFILDV
jgi:hypothetical protein